MTRIKYIIRALLLVFLIAQLAYLNRQTDNALGKIARVKYETLKKANSDSLDTDRKLKLIVKETEEFNNRMVQDSPYIRTGMQRIFGIVTLIVLAEIGMFIARKRTRAF